MENCDFYILDQSNFKFSNDLLQCKFSQLNEKGDKLLILDDKKCLNIFSINEKKWEFSYVLTLVK